MAALSLVTANIHEKAAYAFSVGRDDQPIKTKPGFLNYNNLTYEIGIAYPSNWTKIESGTELSELQKSGLVDYPVTFFARDTLFSKNPISVGNY
jgi:hypothetical protein